MEGKNSTENKGFEREHVKSAIYVQASVIGNSLQSQAVKSFI